MSAIVAVNWLARNDLTRKNLGVTSSWHEMLGLPSEKPDLYEVLGIDRRRFDEKLVERAFAARMQRLSARSDPGEKRLVERAREELLRARRVLLSPEARAVYEEDLKKKERSTPPPAKKAPPAAPPKRPLPPTQFDAGNKQPPERPARDKTVTQADETSSLASAPRRSSLVGRTIDDKYEVVSQLGEGGMGTVFKARHKLLEKFVALKVLNPNLADRPNIRERFLREARAAMEFVHPNAVPLRDFGHTKDGLLYMTQDYSPGRSLRSILDEDGKLDTTRALALARQCLLALGEAHRKNIVHRDVKPENILVEQDAAGADVARLCDFGIAKIADADRTEGGLTGGAVIGTPHYMAPEQAAGDNVDARADIYAMGCVLFELLTGERVFDADTSMQVIMMQVTQQPDPPSKHVAGLPRAIDALVLKALGKTPASRFQTADEFVAAIDQLVPAVRASTSSRRVKVPVAAPAPGPENRVAGLLFCSGCNASISANWREARTAKRLGPKLLCLKCYAPIHDGKSCLGCLRSLVGLTSVAAGKTKRLCKDCAKKGEFLRVCAGCDVLLPMIAFERKEAFAAEGKFFCRDCYKRAARR